MRHTFGNWLRAGALALAGGATLALPATPGLAQTPVTIAICGGALSPYAWTPWAIARQMGWLGGLEVDLVGLAGSPVCMQQLVSGEVLVSQPTIESIVLAQPSPVKMYALIYQRSLSGLAVPENSTIQSVADLRGKRVGASATAASFMVQFRALAREAGLNPDTDIQVEILAPGEPQATAIRNGTVDALVGFNLQFLAAERTGLDLRQLDFGPAGFFPGNGWAATEATIADRADDLVTLARAYAMATIFIATNPEAAARITFAQYPGVFAAGSTEASAIDLLLPILALMTPIHALESGGVDRWGEVPESAFANLVAYDRANAGLTADVSLDDVYTDAFVGWINDFDAAAVAEAARNWR